MATYNPKEEFFRKQVESIKKQTYTHWICLVQDDCSEPNNFVLIKKIIGDDNRFVIVQNKVNMGPYHAFEEGLKRLPDDTQYIAFSDQDDIWLPNKIEKLVETLETSTNAVLVHSDLGLIDAEDQTLAESCWVRENRSIETEKMKTEFLFFRNVVTGCSTMIKKKVLEKGLPFPKQQRRDSFHHDLWLALVSLNYGEVIPLKEALILYRQHSDNVVGAGRRGSLWQKIWQKFSNFGYLKATKNILVVCLENYLWRQDLKNLLLDRFPDTQISFIEEKDYLGIKIIKAKLKAIEANYNTLHLALILWVGNFVRLLK